MAQVPLSLATLGDVAGGAAGMVIDRAITAATSDLDDRGSDGKPRYVDIRICLTPRKDGQAEVDVEASAKVPKYRTPSTVAKVGSKGGEIGLLFQQYAPENPDQRTFNNLDQDK